MNRKIKIARIKKNLDQRKLSEISGVGITSITKMEKHSIDHAKVSALKKLAAALDTIVQDLFLSDEE